MLIEGFQPYKVFSCYRLSVQNGAHRVPAGPRFLLHVSLLFSHVSFINTFKHVKDALYVILWFLYCLGFLSIEQILFVISLCISLYLYIYLSILPGDAAVLHSGVLWVELDLYQPEKKTLEIFIYFCNFFFALHILYICFGKLALTKFTLTIKKSYKVAKSKENKILGIPVLAARLVAAAWCPRPPSPSPPPPRRSRNRPRTLCRVLSRAPPARSPQSGQPPAWSHKKNLRKLPKSPPPPLQYYIM